MPSGFMDVIIFGQRENIWSQLARLCRQHYKPHDATANNMCIESQQKLVDSLCQPIITQEWECKRY